MAYVARQIDVESFGLFVLILSLVGYASVLDGGVARAVIREVALNRTNPSEVARVVGTGFWSMLTISLLCALVFFMSSPVFVAWINVTSDQVDVTISAFHIASLILIPFLLTALWVAPVEGMGFFRSLNITRSVGYIFVFGSVAMAVSLQPSLVSAVWGLLIGRFMMLGLSILSCYSALGRMPIVFDRKVFERLFRFGGWLSLSNIIGSTIDYLDRFVVSAVSGADKVAYYAGPAEMIAKLMVIPHAVSRALFPHLSADSKTKTIIFRDIVVSIKIQLVIGVIIILISVFLAEWIMGRWLGERFAELSGAVFKIFAIGFFFTSLSLIPYTALQAKGHARLTAMVYMIELLPYLVLLIVMVRVNGIQGAAYVWVGKTFFELLAYTWLCKKHLLQVESV